MRRLVASRAARIAPYAKAITGTAIAGLGALGTALTDGAVTPVEWVAIATTTLTASLAVWAVPNGQAAPVVESLED